MSSSCSPRAPESLWDVLTRNAAGVFPEGDLRAKLALGRPLRVKLGLDPTAEHVTLGWAVPLRKLREFQDLGHTAVLIVGDFTARIGDPSGRNKTRPMLSREQVDAFAERVLTQFRLILDSARLEVRRNSEWLEDLGAEGLLALASHATVARMLERDDFARRFADHAPISMLEMLYPLVQGYDSVAVEADVELGGTDQTFNLVTGREMQRAYGQAPQAVLTMPLLEGTDGVEKMSQSKGNYIGITEPPDEMFGKLMRTPDHLMAKFMRLAAWATDDELRAFESAGLNPAEAKRHMAAGVVRLYHGADGARAARERFDSVHVRHEIPDDVPVVDIPEACIDSGEVLVPRLLAAVGLADSSSDGRRLIAQGGISLDGRRVEADRLAVHDLSGRVLQRGRRGFVRLR